MAGDGALRNLAAAEGVDCHGVLWILDQLLHNGLSAKDLHRALTAISRHPRCRLPARQVRERLERYSGLTG